MKPISFVHKNIKKVEEAHKLHNKFLLDPKAPINLFKSLDSKKSQLLPDIPRYFPALIKKGRKHYNILNNLGVNSLIIVPLVTRNKAKYLERKYLLRP